MTARECPTCHKTFQFLHASGQCFGCAVPTIALASAKHVSDATARTSLVRRTGPNTTQDVVRAITYVQCYCGAQQHAYDTQSMRTHNTERAAIQQAINECPKCAKGSN